MMVQSNSALSSAITPTMLALVFVSLKIIIDNKRNFLKPARINKKHYFALNIYIKTAMHRGWALKILI